MLTCIILNFMVDLLCVNRVHIRPFTLATLAGSSQWTRVMLYAPPSLINLSVMRLFFSLEAYFMFKVVCDTHSVSMLVEYPVAAGFNKILSHSL